MSKEGIINRSKSDFNSPLIIVPKPGGDIRPCIDYRELNKIMVPVSFPIPRISDLLNYLGQTTVISSLDLASAYNKCEVRKYTKYEYNRVPFGLQSAPGYFSRVINETLYDILGPEVLAYMDGILIFSKNKEQHMNRI